MTHHETAVFLSEQAAASAIASFHSKTLRDPLILPRIRRGQLMGFTVLGWIDGVRRSLSESEVAAC